MAFEAIRLFRPLIVVAALLHAFLWLAPVLGEDWLTGYDAWLFELDGYGAAVGYSAVLYWCLFASRLLVLAGLFFHVTAARAVFVILVGVSIVLGFMWGIRVLAPFEAALGVLAAVIDGALIAMAYCPPVRAEFERAR